jgi:hypothetical protein
MINAGKPWSAMDMEDLFDFHETGTPIAEIASYLCRTVEEVQAKIDEVESQDCQSMRYRVTGFDKSGSNPFSRVVEAIGPDHARIVALVELGRSFADAHLADQAERLEVAAER